MADEIKLVRRNKETGDVEPRKRGRLNPAFENGYVDGSGKFQAGDPPKRRGRRARRGRPKGSKDKVGRPAGRGRGLPRKSAAPIGGGLSEIERIVSAEVRTRLAAAKAAAMAAFNEALGL